MLTEAEIGLSKALAEEVIDAWAFRWDGFWFLFVGDLFSSMF